MRADQIAIQLYTLRSLTAVDLAGTLQAVADAGFHSVELAGLPATAPGELARILGETGLSAISSHETIDQLRDDADAVADRLLDIGCTRVVVPWFPDGERRTADDVRRFIATLDGFARRLTERGLRLGYHNHDFEFAPFGETTIWDILLAELPRDIDLELDVYWATLAGRDPATEIELAAGRIRLLHMKDLALGPDVRDAPAGQGSLAFPAIVEAARAAGVDWYIVEQDEPASPLADAASALAFLKTLAV